MYADDMAAGADTLEELLALYKALVVALDKAGIQVKASKVEFGVEEIAFHNYKRRNSGSDPLLRDPPDRHSTQGIFRFHTTNGLLRAVLRTSSRRTS